MLNSSKCSISGFDEIVARYQGEIYHYAYHLTRNRAEADDLYQETLRAASRDFNRLDGATNYRAWLYTVATTAFLRNRAQPGRQGVIEGEEASEIPCASEIFDLHCEVRGFVAALPPPQRAALVQRTFHDRSYAEIAASLRCSEAAARTNVYETIRALRHHVGNQL